MPLLAYAARQQTTSCYLNTQLASVNGKLPVQQTASMVNQSGFDALICAYKGSGGTARADDLALLMAENGQGNFSNLDRCIVNSDVFNIEWNNHFWLPMFQFEKRDLSMKRNARKILHELRHVLDNWTLAAWFAEPNAWLSSRRPVDMLDSDFNEVFAAARADRFVATS